jgi:K+-transporting ATPase ATPase C chain
LLRPVSAGGLRRVAGFVSRQGQRQPDRGRERDRVRLETDRPAVQRDKYFHTRPSAAGNGYDGTSSGGSNLGPTSKKLADSIAQNVADYRKQNGLADNAPVPADAVTASGSGLDPHISLHNAGLQAPRVAKTRGLTAEKVQELIRENTDTPDLGFLGEPGVNVLRLNLALDQLPGK